MFVMKRVLVIVVIVYIIICVMFALLNTLSAINNRKGHGSGARNESGNFKRLFISNLAVSLLTTPVGGFIFYKWLERRR